tara:strand:+ start:8068 stop:8373 length:306 start_codon:yes stop_codon:yes gene_type:complete
MDDRQTTLELFGATGLTDKSLEEGTAQQEWDRGGMPEYNNPKKEEFHMIKIRFATKEDMDEFAEIIGQKLTDRTTSIWHPFKSHWGDHIHRFVDENDDEEE